MQLIAFIAQKAVARRILEHLGLDSTGPPLATAPAWIVEATRLTPVPPAMWRIRAGPAIPRVHYKNLQETADAIDATLPRDGSNLSRMNEERHESGNCLHRWTAGAPALPVRLLKPESEIARRKDNLRIRVQQRG